MRGRRETLFSPAPCCFRAGRMKRFSRLAALLPALALAPGPASGQPVDVTFRWIPERTVVRAFLPGEFNGWGPNVNGFIAPGAVSLMTHDADLDQWLYRTTLEAGRTYEYKVHLHHDGSGRQYSWISDPLNDRINPSSFNNSVVTVTDPMVFQLAPRRSGAGTIREVSAGISSSAGIASLTLEVNGEPVDGMPYLDGGVFRYELPETTDCSAHFRLIATDNRGREAAAETGRVSPAVTDEARPQGIRDGAYRHGTDPTRATFSLFAPGKCFVHLIGDFNDWQADDRYLMHRDALRADSVHWWLDLDGLAGEVAYQFLVDGELRIADLYAEKFLDPVHDAAIAAETYPNLRPYPSGKTEGMVSVLEPPRRPYSWNDFESPLQGELVIYELLLRDFLEAHDFATLADTLAYLERLGVNAIELMPVAEFGGNDNWGYQPQFAFAVDKYYGPAEDMKRFVDEAHRRGMAVILDVVYNHVDLPSPLVTLYGATDANRWINLPPRHSYNVFFDINHEDAYIRHWLDRANEYWLTEFRVDGFRFDLSKGFTQRNTGSNAGLWGTYDASRVALLKRMADHIWSVNPRAYVILEHFADDREERELASYGTERGLPGMLLWNNVSHAYGEAVMGYHAGGKSDFSRSYFGRGGRGWPLPHTVSYMESHDEQWLMYKMRQWGACQQGPAGGPVCNPARHENFGTYNVRQMATSLDRLKMAGAFFFLVPGPRMMWQFGEVGYGFGERGEQCLRPDPCPAFAPGRIGAKPIRWDYQADPLRNRLYRFYAALLKLRREHAVFRDPAAHVELDVRGAAKRIDLRLDAVQVQIVGNFDVRPRPNPAILPALTDYWHEFVTGDSLEAGAGPLAELAPGEFRIYSSARLGAAPDGVVTVGTEGLSAAPDQLLSARTYPNPFAGQAVIEFSMPAPARVRLEAFDSLGRRVAVIVDRYLAAGRHTVPFDASGLPAGVYTYRLVSGRHSHSGAMLVLR